MTVAAPLIPFRSQPHALPPCWRCIFEEQKTTAFVGARIRILFEKTGKAGQRKSIAMAQAMAHLVHADWYHRLGRTHLDSNCGWTSGVKNKAIVARGHQHKDQYLLVRQLQPVSSRSSACRGTGLRKGNAGLQEIRQLWKGTGQTSQTYCAMQMTIIKMMTAIKKARNTCTSGK